MYIQDLAITRGAVLIVIDLMELQTTCVFVQRPLTESYSQEKDIKRVNSLDRVNSKRQPGPKEHKNLDRAAGGSNRFN